MCVYLSVQISATSQVTRLQIFESDEQLEFEHRRKELNALSKVM